MAEEENKNVDTLVSMEKPDDGTAPQPPDSKNSQYVYLPVYHTNQLPNNRAVVYYTQPQGSNETPTPVSVSGTGPSPVPPPAAIPAPIPQPPAVVPTTTAAASSNQQALQPPYFLPIYTGQVYSSPENKKKKRKSKKKERTVKKRRKDPNAPKNPISAYLFFVAAQRVLNTGSNDGRSFSEVAKDLGTKWKSLPDDEKQTYIELAKKDKIRYLKEKEEYIKKQGSSQMLFDVESETSSEDSMRKGQLPYAYPASYVYAGPGGSQSNGSSTPQPVLYYAMPPNGFQNAQVAAAPPSNSQAEVALQPGNYYTTFPSTNVQAQGQDDGNPLPAMIAVGSHQVKAAIPPNQQNED